MSKFEPAWWLPGPHAQTIWPSLFRRLPHVPMQRERLTLPDGDFLDLDWSGECNGPIVVILHGLQGSVESHYTKGIIKALVNQEYRTVVMNFRGCSGEVNKTSKHYHFGETGDLNAVIRHIESRYPNTPLAAVGYSLGGNILLKYLGEQGANSPIQAATAVSVPLYIPEATKRLNQGVAIGYREYLMREIRRDLERKLDNVDMPINKEEVRYLRTFEDYDERVTAPIYGFENAKDYYEQTSSRKFLSKIKRPTLIIHAEDDPFMTPAVVPDPHELSEAITFELSPSGGHVGFVGGKYPWRPRYWLEERIPKFLKLQLKHL